MGLAFVGSVHTACTCRSAGQCLPKVRHKLCPHNAPGPHCPTVQPSVPQLECPGAAPINKTGTLVTWTTGNASADVNMVSAAGRATQARVMMKAPLRAV